MRRIVIGVVLAGLGVLVARALVPKLHARLLAGCERMFERMPEEFPAKRLLRGVDEIRANTARMLVLLEDGKHAREAVPAGKATSTRTGRSGDATRVRWGVSILSDGEEVRNEPRIGSSPR